MTREKRRRAAWLLILPCLLAPHPARAAEPGAPPTDASPASASSALAGFGDQPVNVTADAMTVEESGALIRFEGKVVLKRGKLTLTCDRLLLRPAEGDPSQVRTGEADGAVVLAQGADRAEAVRATFDLAAGRVVLTGSPFLLRGTDTIRGSEITYTTADGRAAVKGPVEAVFTPPPVVPGQAPGASPDGAATGAAGGAR
jgi:lipopolysaccharide export system protein LptA